MSRLEAPMRLERNLQVLVLLSTTDGGIDDILVLLSTADIADDTLITINDNDMFLYSPTTTMVCFLTKKKKKKKKKDMVFGLYC